LYSVVVLTKNSARTLGQCLQGLSDSEPRPLDVVIVDGGSTDDTLSICSRFTNGLQVKTLFDYKRGLGYARDIGWRGTSLEASYVAMVDSDVVVPKGFFRRAEELMENDERLGGLSGKLYSECQEGGLFAKFQTENLAMFIHQREAPYPARAVALHTACTLFRRKALEQVNGFSEVFSLANEDSDISFKLRNAGYRLSYLDFHARHLETGKRLWKINIRYGRSSVVLSHVHPDKAPLWTPKRILYTAAVFVFPLQAGMLAWYFRRYRAETPLSPRDCFEMSLMETLRQGLRSVGRIMQLVSGDGGIVVPGGPPRATGPE
jgi:GT2 family glycosyltransferase